MRVVVTGGAGFIGRAIVKRLVERGDHVAALVRDPAKATYLAGDHVTLIASDLHSVPALTEQMRGAGGVIHAAGSYRIGIKAAEKPQMWDANVGTTERVLDAAIAAGVPRILYVSTLNVFGNTRGKKPDETYRRDLAEGFLSYYDETKYRAHEAAEKRMAARAPVVIVMPSQVYGPYDHTIASAQLEQAHAGKLSLIALGDAGNAWVYVDDLAAGVVAALDRGQSGETYILGGENYRLRDAIALAARTGGRKPPRISLPTALLRLIAPINDRVGGLPGFPPNLREVIRAGDGVTYWATHDKATRELGFQPRSLERGIADTWGQAKQETA
jgi:dihydroflavonol-4-reductase